MKGPPLPVTFYWQNPPGPKPTGVAVRIIKGAEYERQVGPRGLLDVHEAAAALGTRHAFSVYRLIWEGRLQAVRRGRNLQIPLASVAEYRATRQRPRGRRKAPSHRWLVG